MSLVARLRHPAAAVLAVAGVVVGSVALIGTAASAADGDATGTTTFTCTVGSFDPYDYEATITVSASRAAAGATKVAVDADISDMPGVVPLTLGSTAVTDQLVLDLGGTAVTLTGTGTATIAKDTAFPMPSMTGTLTTDADSVSVTVTSFSFAMPAYSMSGSCTPTDGADLGTLTIGTGATSTPTDSATTTPTESATATPTESATATATATETTAAEATPAKGKVAFACTLQPFASDFDYDATVTVSGYREAEGEPVQLVAKMSDLPGIAPVTIDGDMDVTLDAEVGGTALTLKGSGHASAEPEAEVAVPKLTGEVDTDEDDLEVAITAFTFNFAALSVAADCTSDRTVLSRMVVGTEPPDDEETDEASPSAEATDSVSDGGGTGSLPKTGGADSTPVVLLWAGAFVLLGTAGLLAVPQARTQLRRRTQD